MEFIGMLVMFGVAMIAVMAVGIIIELFILYVLPSLVFICIIYAIFKNREAIARWCYSLTPHPADHMVRSAIAAGDEIDGEAFRQILQPLPGGRIEQQVRADQAAKLAELARQSNAELRRKAEELRRRVQEAAAIQAANRDLHDAVVEQQLAKAEADALAEVEAFLKGLDKNDRW